MTDDFSLVVLNTLKKYRRILPEKKICFKHLQIAPLEYRKCTAILHLAPPPELLSVRRGFETGHSQPCVVHREASSAMIRSETG
jgi:hypothetical protein